MIDEQKNGPRDAYESGEKLAWPFAILAMLLLLKWLVELLSRVDLISASTL